MIVTTATMQVGIAAYGLSGCHVALTNCLHKAPCAPAGAVRPCQTARSGVRNAPFWHAIRHVLRRRAGHSATRWLSARYAEQPGKNIKYYKNRFAKAIAPCGMMPGVNARQRQSVTPRLAPPDCRGRRPAPPRPHRRVQTRALRRAQRQPPIQRAQPHSRP